MNSVFRYSLICLGLVLAAGAGYWAAQRQDTSSSAVLPSEGQDQAGKAVPEKNGRKILYYRNPMGLPDTSPVPKKDSMGMDYIAVYEDDRPDDSGVVVVSPVRIQTLGVKTATVELGIVDAVVRASGRVEIDERTQVVVAPRFEGWVERLHVNAVGDPVRKGQALFTAYSPELQSIGEELRISEQLVRQSAGQDPVANESARRLVEATKARLRNLEVAGQARARQVFHALASGVVLEKRVIEGGRFKPGDILFRIADLSTVWIIADVHERDLARVQVGQSAQITLEAFPGRDFEARVAYLYPTLDTPTRSTRVRLELDNTDGLLRSGMFAEVVLSVGATKTKVVAPASAIIDDGERQVVLLALGEGRFKPQPVRLGQRGRSLVEVLEGVKAGDRVVVSANFLIDSESQIKAALSNLMEADTQEQTSTPGYETDGTLEAIDAEADSLTVTHSEIPALGWPAMTMDFTVADRRMLQGITPGMAVRLVFRAGEPGEYIVTDITPLANAAPPAVSAGHEGH